MANTAYFFKSMALKIIAITAKAHSIIKTAHPIVLSTALIEQSAIGVYVPAINMYMAQWSST